MTAGLCIYKRWQLSENIDSQLGSPKTPTANRFNRL